MCTSESDFANLMRNVVSVAGPLSYHGFDVGVLKKEPIRVAITGAAGAIGYALIPRVASGEVFGYDQPIILHLLELEAALPSLQGVAMETRDSAFPLIRDIITTSDLAQGFKEVDYAFLVGAKPRVGKMERKDLLSQNADIFSVQGKALNENAKKTCLTWVVGNPANTNALIKATNAPNIPPENFSAMMRLDHNRALAQVAKAYKAQISDIENMVIWGNHSATQVPDVSFVKVSGQKLDDANEEWLSKDFIPVIQQRGAAIIAARGSSSAFSAADAAIQHMRDWVQGSNGKWVSMACPTDGTTYGVEKGLYSSFPVICLGNGKVQIVKDLKITAENQKRIQASVKELKEERDAVKDKLGKQQVQQTSNKK